MRGRRCGRIRGVWTLGGVGRMVVLLQLLLVKEMGVLLRLLVMVIVGMMIVLVITLILGRLGAANDVRSKLHKL